MSVAERLLSVDELIAAMENGTLEEAWGCGTAAVDLAHRQAGLQRHKTYIVNGGEIGEVTHMLYDTLTGIQWGKIDDALGWTHKIGFPIGQGRGCVQSAPIQPGAIYIIIRYIQEDSKFHAEHWP